jgi:hypothetical protein
MNSKTALAAYALLAACCAFRIPFAQAGAQASDTVARLRYWNEAALTANAIDHTRPLPGTSGIGEQPGPTRTSRALAIVHIAIFDALNAIAGR